MCMCFSASSEFFRISTRTENNRASHLLRGITQINYSFMGPASKSQAAHVSALQSICLLAIHAAAHILFSCTFCHQ